MCIKFFFYIKHSAHMYRWYITEVNIATILLAAPAEVYMFLSPLGAG